MYTTTDKPEHVHRMKGSGLEASGSTRTETGGGDSATQKMEEKGKNVMEKMKEKMPGMHK
jgi:hypothetical protein